MINRFRWRRTQVEPNRSEVWFIKSEKKKKLGFENLHKSWGGRYHPRPEAEGSSRPLSHLLVQAPLEHSCFPLLSFSLSLFTRFLFFSIEIVRFLLWEADSDLVQQEKKKKKKRINYFTTLINYLCLLCFYFLVFPFF